MPIMDGGTSATQIRGFESKLKQPIPTRHTTHGRIPIFAVSATLYESRVNEYVDMGFDGWILKPIDFQRLDLMLKATRDPEVRQTLEYMPGRWELGGWFFGAPEELTEPQDIEE